MSLFLSPRAFATRFVRGATSPYYRYRYARLLHAVRVGFAMLASILVTTGIDIPDGIWASVTVLTVIGGLQHHGNIRKRALERALGTVVGAFVGLMVLLPAHALGSAPLLYVLLSVAAAFGGYFAIGRPGYIALLAAITVCIVAGHGESSIDTGLWRTLNVLIGIAVALAFSFALPLYATYSWRYLMARNLRECAHTYMRIASGVPIDTAEQLTIFAGLGQRLVKLRSLMPSVAKEIDLPLKDLESIQRLNRSLLSALELMVTAAQSPGPGKSSAIGTGKDDLQVHAVRATLIAMARALRSGSDSRAWLLSVGKPAVADASAADAPPPSGPHWLAQRFADQVDTLRMLLAQTQAYWHIRQHSRTHA